MAANILGVRISKSQQLSNWEAETLNEHQQMYAATDAWICREMYLKLQTCEKHPLKPEEILPPEQQPLAIRDPEAAERKRKEKEERIAAEKSRQAAARKRRYYRNKKKKSNDKGLPEKGA
jgi:ribonuclease D